MKKFSLFLQRQILLLTFKTSKKEKCNSNHCRHRLYGIRHTDFCGTNLSTKMRTTLLFLFLSLMAQRANSTDADTVKLKVNYAVKCYQYKGQEQPKNDEMVLEVGSKYVHFYSRYSVERRHIQDSILAAGGTAQDVLAAQAKSMFPRPPQHFQIWKNYPESGKLTFTDVLLKMYIYTEDLLRPKWELLSQDSIVAGYACRKATTHYRGRTWNVWYTPEISVPEGPWQLFGLPGLILEAEDSEHLFSFSCIEIKQTFGKPMNFPKKKSIECSKEEYYQLKKLEWLDPYGFAEKISGFRSKGYDAQGREIVYPKRIAIFLDNDV